MKICYFGDYNEKYPRIRTLIRGLKENGIEIIECQSGEAGIKKYIKLYKQHKKIGSYDLMVVGYTDNRYMVPFAKLLSRTQLAWDAFYSIYDNWVYDRKLVSPISIKAFYYWFIDWMACLFSDIVILETNEHIKYFSKTFKKNINKFIRIFIGANDKYFYPEEEKTGKRDGSFLVQYHGGFIPCQGIQYIVKAAKLLEDQKDIRFRIIGSGQEKKNIVKLAEEIKVKNLEFIERKPYEELIKYIHESDVTLGNFGDTAKTTRVIANKSFESIAAKVAHISADVPAMREFFVNRENILFCQRANPRDLADKISELKNNPDLKKKIEDNGYKLYLSSATPKVLAKMFINDLKDKFNIY